MHWLFVPLRESDVLVAGERVLYCERRHWAALVPELAQFIAVLFLHSAFSMRGTTGMGDVLLVGTILAVVTLWPLLRRDRWDTWQLAMMALGGVWAVAAGVGLEGLALLLVVVMAIRFAVRALRWAVYQRTYLTNRRLMEVDGFLGIQVLSMPIVKVTDVMLKRTPIGEVLGYGTFRVESAGQEQALGELNYLLDAERFHDMVVAAPTWG